MAFLEVTSFDQTVQSLSVFGLVRSQRLVRLQRLHVGRFTHNALDLVATTCPLDIGGKCPLADAPILNWTIGIARILVTGHVLRATPVGLASRVAKIFVTAITTQTR